MTTTRIETSSPSRSRRTSDEMLFIGQRCSHDACNLVDFLPLKCQYCHQPYCSSHFSLSTHLCPDRPPEYTLNRTAPLCPLCNTPISSLPGEDPNIPMERHINSPSECTGKEAQKEVIRRKKERGEVCWKKGCMKVLFAKIRCEACKHDYCAPHRYPNQHACPSLASSISPTTGNSAAAAAARSAQKLDTKLAGVNSNNPLLAKLRAKQAGAGSSSTSTTTKESTSTSKPGVSSNSLTHLPFGARRDAALAAMKRLGQSTGSSTPAPVASASMVTGGPGEKGTGKVNGEEKMDMASMRQKFKLGPSTTDKQAAAELSSIFKSLENRYKKGLLSESEKVRYAEMCAEKEKARRLGMGKGGKEGDCVIC